jgi:hypothetical protein
VSIASNIRRVERHREILACPGIRERVLAYMAERTSTTNGHALWTGPRFPNTGAPKGAIYASVVWDDGTMSDRPTFDPRLLTWALAGLPFDDSVAILPTCGRPLCLSHLDAVPWTELGPAED